VHSLFGITDFSNGSGHPQSEDVIFAFQERLCAIIEVEVEMSDGRSVQVFPTRLNVFLSGPDSQPAADPIISPIPIRSRKDTSIPVARKLSSPQLPSENSAPSPQLSSDCSPGPTVSPQSSFARLSPDVALEFNVSAIDLQLVFGSAPLSPTLNSEEEIPIKSLAAILVRADSDDAD
jgi:hypothetical protein